MSPTKAPPLLTWSSTELCSILEACARAGVREFSYGALTVSFGKQTNETSVEQAPPPISVKVNAEPNHQKMSEDILEGDELVLREDQIAELLITDPLRAEEMIRSGELEDDDGLRTDGSE